MRDSCAYVSLCDTTYAMRMHPARERTVLWKRSPLLRADQAAQVAFVSVAGGFRLSADGPSRTLHHVTAAQPSLLRLLPGNGDHTAQYTPVASLHISATVTGGTPSGLKEWVHIIGAVPNRLACRSCARPRSAADQSCCADSQHRSHWRPW